MYLQEYLRNMGKCKREEKGKGDREEKGINRKGKGKEKGKERK